MNEGKAPPMHGTSIPGECRAGFWMFLGPNMIKTGCKALMRLMSCIVCSFLESLKGMPGEAVVRDTGMGWNSWPSPSTILL